MYVLIIKNNSWDATAGIYLVIPAADAQLPAEAVTGRAVVSAATMLQTPKVKGNFVFIKVKPKKSNFYTT